MRRQLAWVLVICGSFITASIAIAQDAPGGWKAAAPRDEIKPSFKYEAKGGAVNGERLIIQCDEREGLDGYWIKTLPVEGGKHYRFSAKRRIEHVESPRRSVVARLLWRDDLGKPVKREEPVARDSK